MSKTNFSARIMGDINIIIQWLTLILQCYQSLWGK